MAQTPDQELATTITEALVSEELILPDKKGEFETRLSTGSLRQEDWRFFIEMALMKNSKEPGNAQAD